MRLFQVLFRRKHMPPGHIYRGKRRLIKEPTWEDLQKLRNAFELEEQNMFYLRHPYLTVEQEHGHTAVLGRKEENFLKVRNKPKVFKDNVTIESRLGHIRYVEPWE